MDSFALLIPAKYEPNTSSYGRFFSLYSGKPSMVICNIYKERPTAADIARKEKEDCESHTRAMPFPIGSTLVDKINGDCTKPGFYLLSYDCASQTYRYISLVRERIGILGAGVSIGGA